MESLLIASLIRYVDKIKRLMPDVKKNIAVMAICTVIISMLSSCVGGGYGVSPNNFASFVGTWQVTSNSCGVGNSSISISANSNNDTLIVTNYLGKNNCLAPVTEYGTVYTNVCTFSPQAFTDSCGNAYTISLTGTVSYTTLNATETITGHVNTTCTFTATLQ